MKQQHNKQFARCARSALSSYLESERLSLLRYRAFMSAYFQGRACISMTIGCALKTRFRPCFVIDGCFRVSPSKPEFMSAHYNFAGDNRNSANASFASGETNSRKIDTMAQSKNSAKAVSANQKADKAVKLLELRVGEILSLLRSIEKAQRGKELQENGKAFLLVDDTNPVLIEGHGGEPDYLMTEVRFHIPQQRKKVSVSEAELEYIISEWAGDNKQDEPCIIDGFYVWADWSGLGEYYCAKILRIDDDGRKLVLDSDCFMEHGITARDVVEFILDGRDEIEVNDNWGGFLFLESYGIDENDELDETPAKDNAAQLQMV